MNVLKLSDIAPVKYENVFLSDDALCAQNVCDALNHKLNVYVSSVIGIDGKAHEANAISDDVQFLGNIGFRGNDLCIIEGNYIQTAYKNRKGETLSGIYNFSGANSFLQAEEAKSGNGDSYGIACTGAKGWPILSIDNVNSRIKLSGDLHALITMSDEQKKLAWSMTVESVARTSCVMIVGTPVQESLTAGWVQVNEIPVAFKDKRISADLSTESMYIDCYLSDDNAFYCPFDPTIGATNIDNFYANHAEGGSTKAIGKYTHAEGRQTIADIRYAHAEGSHCFAGGMASHCEGFGNANDLNVALGQASHCEGDYNKAFGDASHVEGSHNIAAGKWSHASGRNAHAMHDGSYVWSGGTVISSHGNGTYTVNPPGGINGFYIGSTSLGTLVQGGANVIKVYSATSVDVVNSNGTIAATSLKDAIHNKAKTANVIQLQNDITLDFTQSINQNIYFNKDYTLDLNGHVLSVINTNNSYATNYVGSSVQSYFFMNVNTNSNLTVKNGKIFASKSCLFRISEGCIQFINAQVTTDNLLMYMTASAYNKRLKFIADEKSVITSKYSEVRCPDKQNNYAIWVSRTNNIASDPDYKNYSSLSAYREAHPEYFPHLVFKGEMTVEGPECVPGKQASTIVYQNGGNNMMGMTIDVEEGAKLNCPNGVALYSGNNNLITLNGGLITGATGIGLRGGKLVVPAKSNVTVLGTGYAEAPVQHVNAGWATCCSNGSALLVLAQDGYGSNRPFSTTENTQEVDIESGRFISLKNEPIASIAMWKKDTYTEGDVYPRIEKFVNGGYLSQFPDSQKYDEETGQHSSYSIVADGCYEQTPCQIMRAVS